MKTEHVLHGLRFRDDESRAVEATLFERVEPHVWRARIKPPGQARAGDRLRFGETSESTACLLGYLDAEVTAIAGDEALLSFALTGPVLDEALDRLAE